MILEYDEKFENTRQYYLGRFIGYITPEGEALGYMNPFGMGGHDRNLVTDFFTKYFYYDLEDDYGRFITINDKLHVLEAQEFKDAYREHCLSNLPNECQEILYKLNNGYNIYKDDKSKLK